MGYFDDYNNKSTFEKTTDVVSAVEIVAGVVSLVDGTITSAEASGIVRRANKALKAKKKLFQTASDEVESGLNTLFEFERNIASRFEKASDIISNITQTPEFVFSIGDMALPKLSVTDLQKVSATLEALSSVIVGAEKGTYAAFVLSGKFGAFMDNIAILDNTAVGDKLNELMSRVTSTKINSSDDFSKTISPVANKIAVGTGVMISGFEYSKQSKEKLMNAKKYEKEVEKSISKLDESIAFIEKLKDAVDIFKNCMLEMQLLLDELLSYLHYVVYRGRKTDYSTFNELEALSLQCLFELLMLLVNMFKLELVSEDESTHLLVINNEDVEQNINVSSLIKAKLNVA